MKKTALLSGLLMLVIGALLALAAFLWLPHCKGETPMRCVWMLRAVAGTGVMIALLGLFMQFSSRAVAMGMQAANALLGLQVVALSTVLIGSCPNPLMRCHTVTEPVLIVVGAVIALVALVDLWRLSRQHG